MSAAVAAVVLAAGASRRMGRPKALLPVGSETLLARVLRAYLGSPLGEVLLVLGRDAEAVRGSALPVDPRLRVVVNPDWAEGLSSSLRCGVEALAAGPSAAVLVGLGDQPSVTSELVSRVASAWVPGVGLVVPVHGGRAVHPVLFGRALWPELGALTGDVGAREVVRRHWAAAVQVAGEPPVDLDDEQDYRAFLEGRPRRGGGLPVLC